MKTIFHVCAALSFAMAGALSIGGHHDKAVFAVLSAILLKLFSIGEELRA